MHYNFCKAITDSLVRDSQPHLKYCFSQWQPILHMEVPQILELEGFVGLINIYSSFYVQRRHHQFSFSLQHTTSRSLLLHSFPSAHVPWRPFYQSLTTSLRCTGCLCQAGVKASEADRAMPHWPVQLSSPGWPGTAHTEQTHVMWPLSQGIKSAENLTPPEKPHDCLKIILLC